MNPSSTPKRIALVLGAAALVSAGAVGGAAAINGGGDDVQDRPISPAVLERAEKAALDEAGGGTVTATEVDDEESKYEVEVTLDDGAQVDVQLDENLQVVATEDDGTEVRSDDD